MKSDLTLCGKCFRGLMVKVEHDVEVDVGQLKSVLDTPRRWLQMMTTLITWFGTETIGVERLEDGHFHIRIFTPVFGIICEFKESKNEDSEKDDENAEHFKKISEHMKKQHPKEKYQWARTIDEKTGESIYKCLNCGEVID